MALIKCPECKKKISDQCSNCPHCGYSIQNYVQQQTAITNSIEVLQQENPSKQPFYKKTWVWIVAGVTLLAIIIGTIFLLTLNTKPKLDKEGNPVFIELTNEVYTNAKKYKGYHINIKGQVFQVMSDNGSVKGIQVWIDPDTCEQNLMIYYNTDVEVKQGDYIMCSGYIDSVAKYKNAFGATLYAPSIVSTDLKQATYIEVMAPTIATITPENLKQEQLGYSISVDKIEFSKRETRVYVTAVNNGKAMLYFSNTVIVQNGKQYNSETNYEADYDEIPFEIVKGVKSSGIIVFPVINTEDFELTIDVHSSDYDEALDKFTFKVSKDNIVVEKPVETKPTTTPSLSRKEQAVIIALNNASETTTPNALKSILEENGFSSDEINYAVYGGHINWQEHIPNFVSTILYDEAEVIISTCSECGRKYYGNYSSCQYLSCGRQGMGWSYHYGYSRTDTISKLLSAGYSQADVDAVMQTYTYGEFIDEKDFSDCIVVEGELCEHSWMEATCQTPSTCAYCDKTKGELAECEYYNHKCIYCGKEESEEPWTPPKIDCSEWVSLKELQEKAGYYITTPGNTITIEDLNDDRVNFVLVGSLSGQHGVIYELDYNGVAVHFKYVSDSNNWYQMVKLQYSDLVAIGALS